ncbi:MAG: LPS-assembly protein LptD [Bacteroidetes bacterium]|nr:LPS-assembly protein LptD [Bacteroidota bacterium]
MIAIGTILWSYEVFGQVMAPPDQGMSNVGSMETGIGTDGANSGSGTPANAVRFQANDSLIVRLLNGRKAFLFGTAKITHSTGTLLAGKINMNLDSTTVEARGSSLQDSLTMPVLTMGEDEIKSNRILFNYKTEKGKFEDAQVNVSDGLLIGAKIKNVNKSEVFIQDGIYSTCPPDYLYYYLEAKQMKVVDEEEIFFTNARLYVLDIPYPFVLPFGYVPAQMDKKRSGLLTPTYVFDAQASKGIGLHNLGWFQYINDYVTTTLSADVFTSGTYYANNSTQYRLADRFSGAITLGYSRDQGLEPTDPDFSTQINKSIGIRHQQTISPYASISANVNLRTADFFNQNSFNIEDRAQTSSTSRIAYNYRDPEGLFSFSTNASMVQNFFTNSTSLDGPGFTFSTKTLSPFKPSGSGSNAKWYESITLRYNNNFDSNFDYRPIDADTASIGFIDAFLSPSQYREATGTNDYIQLGLKQSANLTVGKIIDSPYINSSVGVQLNEYWYPSSINKRFDPETNQVITDKVNGFVAGRDFSSSLSLSTTLYGTSTKKKVRLVLP